MSEIKVPRFLVKAWIWNPIFAYESDIGLIMESGYTGPWMFTLNGNTSISGRSGGDIQC